VIEDARAPAFSTEERPAAFAEVDPVWPTSPEHRILSIDVLRGVAVLGILLMNIVAMALPYAAYDDPTIAGNRSPVDFWTWAVNAVLIEGRMRAIFSMLFGAGVILIASRIGASSGTDAAADVHLRRNLWLVLFGALHAYLLLWPGEVLFTYGVAGLPLFAFRRVRPRNLILFGAVLLALQVPRVVIQNLELATASEGLREIARATADGRALTSEQQHSKSAWTNTLSERKPTPEALRQAIDARRGGYISNFAESAGASMYVESAYLYTAGVWDAGGMMLIGMGLLGLGVFSASRSYRFYVATALAGYGFGIPLGTWAVSDWMRHGFEAGSRWVSLDDLTRVAVALGHVAVVMIVCKSGAASWVTARLAAVGRMALSNYIMQTIISMAIFRGFGLGWFGQLARHELYYIVGAVWVFQLTASTFWLRRFRFGPMEWAWRSLTYQRLQPLRWEHSR
jgi:uncharacterized protein